MEQLDFYVQSIFDFLLENSTPEFAFKFVIAYFFISWISIIVWVIKDISIRTSSVLFQIFCVLLVLIWTPLALPIYLLFRPRRTLYDLYFEDIEENFEIFDEIVKEIKREREEDEEVRIRNFVKQSKNFKPVPISWKLKVESWKEEEPSPLAPLPKGEGEDGEKEGNKE